MNIKKSKLVSILKNNIIILQLYNHFKKDEVFFDLVKQGELEYTGAISVNDGYRESNLLLNIDVSRYNEKFSDINKYEVEDMGIIIKIHQFEDDEEESFLDLTYENMWEILFLNCTTYENIDD